MEFEIWHLIIIIPLGILGLFLNDFIRKNMRK
jgi:hypothetical protein